MPKKGQSKPKSKGKPTKAGGKTGAKAKTKPEAKPSGTPSRSQAPPLDKVVRQETKEEERLMVAAEPTASEGMEDMILSATYQMQDPLQTVSGFLELLVGGKVAETDESRRLAGVVFRESMYLSHLVANLQAALMIHAGQFKVRPTPLLIDRLIEVCAQPFTAITGYRDQELTLSLPPNLPNLQGDEAHLSQAITTLLQLTLHRAAEGERVVVGAQATKSDLVVQIAILDNKHSQEELGIPEAMESTVISEIGNGLGLFVARYIVNQHEGNIFEQKVADGDHRIIVVLPLRGSSQSKGKILIVEDSRHTALLVEFALQQEGYECVSAMDGLKALQMAKAERPDLIVLDVLLPGIDGFEVCHRLRASPKTESIPIIMVSAKAREEDRATALRVGADAYLKKPLGMAELTGTIDQLLRGPLDDPQGEANGSQVSI